MIKKLIALVLVLSMGSASCATTQNSTALLLDAEALSLIKQEVEVRLQQEAKTNKKVAFAMQTEAAKRQLIAYFITGIVVAGGIAAVVWYFHNVRVNEAAAAKEAADKAKAAADAARQESVPQRTATGNAAAANVMSGFGKTAQQSEKFETVFSKDQAAILSVELQKMRAEMLASIAGEFKAVASRLATDCIPAEKPASDPVLSQRVFEAKMTEVLKAMAAQSKIPVEPISTPASPAVPDTAAATDPFSAGILPEGTQAAIPTAAEGVQTKK